MSAATALQKVTIWSAAGLARLSWSVTKTLARPSIGAPLATTTALAAWGVSSGPAAPIAATAGVGAALATWRHQHGASFTRVVGVRALSWWGLRVRYGLRWHSWMGRVGLSLTDETTGKTVRPALVKVRCTPATDSLLVDLPAGFTPDAVTAVLDDIANAARVGEARVRRDRPGRVWVDLLARDPLTATVLALPIPATADISALSGVPVGRCLDGEAWRLALLGNSVLIAGMSGSGKASIMWSLIRGITPHVRAGLVRMIGLDPKGGMELAWTRSLFATFCDGSLAEMADVLEAEVANMRARAKRMAGVTRTFTPTTTAPLTVIVADELLILTSLAPRDQYRDAARIEAALGALLVQGRAVGWTVIGATQDVRGDKLPMRDFFQTRIALRMATAGQVDLILGEGARDAGAPADRIPRATPGVAYVREGDDGDPIRVRAAYVTDTDLTHMNEQGTVRPGLRIVTDTDDDEGDTTSVRSAA